MSSEMTTMTPTNISRSTLPSADLATGGDDCALAEQCAGLLELGIGD
jgi:hypothetical protein